MLEAIQLRCEILSQRFAEINNERKIVLDQLSAHITEKLKQNREINLLYVCTHNSRRSHMGQVWAKTAAAFYGLEVNTFSAGTEVTAFNPHAVNALVRAGFRIEKSGETNPVYKVFYSDSGYSECFSKKIEHETLPKQNFIAVMTCEHADENCPFIPGADARITVTYHDPKAYDNTVMKNEKYTERSNQVAMECLYVFSIVKNQMNVSK